MRNKFRIIPISGCDTCKEVLLFIERNDNGEDYLKIIAWHTFEDGDEYIQVDEFDSASDTNDQIIHAMLSDFSEKSALGFSLEFKR
jgi:hypothetical protein